MQRLVITLCNGGFLTAHCNGDGRISEQSAMASLLLLSTAGDVASIATFLSKYRQRL